MKRNLSKKLLTCSLIVMFVMTMWTGAGAFSSRELCFIDFESFSDGDDAFQTESGNVISQNYGTATLSTKIDYAAGGAQPLLIQEIDANSGNKAIEFSRAGQYISLNLNESVDLNDADEDDFVFEFKFAAGTGAPRLRVIFRTADNDAVFTLNVGAQSYQVNSADNGGIGELNKFTRDLSSPDTVKVVFKRDSENVLLYINGSIATRLTTGEEQIGHRTEGFDEVSRIFIDKNTTDNTKFYLDDLYAYEQMDISVPEGIVDFEDDYYTNPDDDLTYLFPEKKDYIYGNITVRSGKGDNTGIMGGAAPTLIVKDPLDDNNHCLLHDNTSDPITQFSLAEAYELSSGGGKDLVFEYDFYAEGAATRFNTIAMLPGTTTAFRAAAAATDIRFTGSETSGQQFFAINYPFGLTEGWHNYKMVIKGETLTADFYVDDILRVMDVEPASFSGDTLSISGFRFQGAANATAKPAYLDNIKIYLADSAPETDEILITRPYIYATGTYTQIRDFNRYGANDYQARMNIKIPDASAQNPYELFMITAHYSQEGRLKGVVVDNGITITTNEPTGISGTTYTTSENPASGDYLKVMLWDGEETMFPVMAPSFTLGN